MHHLKAFTNSVASMAKDLTKDISMSAEDNKSVGMQHTFGSRTVVEERLLSEGGFGFVHLVRDVNSNQQYVIKKILCQDKERYEMACREVELFEKLPIHPNLVRYYGHIVEKDRDTREVIMLMEFCPGGHVYDMMLKHKGCVPTVEIVRVMKDITNGLIALHAIGVQHRDLKLENVLLNSSGKYVLLDFGSWSSSSPDTSNITKEEFVKLEEIIERYTTLMYRPPEMADLYKGFKISTKVDMWMLGCILFTLINNKHPFQDASNLAIVNGRYSFSVECCQRQDCPKLIQMTYWLLANNPADRPSAPELAQALYPWNSTDSLALPKAVTERLEKDARVYGIPNTMSKRKSSKDLKNVWPAETAAVSNEWEANFSPQPAPVVETVDLLDLLG